MQTYFFAEQPLTYDGRQLSPHWLYRQFDLLGDAIAAFTGPCRVELAEMVDLEDVKAALLRRYAAEVHDIWLARCKVRAVRE